MFSYTKRREVYSDFIKNEESSVLDLGDIVMNSHERMLLSKKPYWFEINEFIGKTVADQQLYNLPYNCRKLLTLTITVGTTQYTPKEITSFDQWNRINFSTSVNSDSPTYYFVYRNKVGIYPTPSTDDFNIKFVYEERFKDLSIPDYITGSITTATNGDKTIVGTGTTWTNQMIGRKIRIDDGNSTGSGDGYWYKIASVTSTTELELEVEYQGIDISSGTASYNIGQVSLLPEEYELMPVYHAAMVYWSTENKQIERANMFKNLYLEQKDMFDKDHSNQSSSVVVNDMQIPQINPNLFIRK
jgi:hypothetical protein